MTETKLLQPVWRTGEPLFKYVDEGIASRLEQGSIKIGTFRGFANLESDRADPDEGTATLVHSGVLTENDDNFLEKISHFGVKVMGNIQLHDWALENNEVRNELPDINCFCTSDRAGLRQDTPNGPDACFRIDDIEAFMKAIGEACPDFARGMVQGVTYGTRTVDIRHRMPPKMPDPFLKPLKFQNEHEVRFLFEGRPGYIVRDIIVESKALARLMTRIA